MKRVLTSVAVIAGAMKSGTTTLYAYLQQHPAVCCPKGGVKELDFFTSDAFSGGVEAYRRLFDFGEDHNLALDASPNYTKYPAFPNTPSRMRGFRLDFKFIYLMRNPVDRIESQLAHNVAKGRIRPKDITEPRRLVRPTHVSSYGMQLDHLAAAFPNLNQRLLMLDFHEFVRDPMSTVRQVERFLGLPPLDYADVGIQNQHKARHGSDKVRLDADTRRVLWDRLLPDLRRLKEGYGFAPADRWIVEAERVQQDDELKQRADTSPLGRSS